VDGLGVIGLAVGLWISLATPARRGALQRALPAALGWLLVATCGVLLLSGTLSAPATLQAPGSGVAGSTGLSGQTGALGPAMPAWAYTRPGAGGNGGACAQSGSTPTAGGVSVAAPCGPVGNYSAP
jgi:hypothetical protein